MIGDERPDPSEVARRPPVLVSVALLVVTVALAAAAVVALSAVRPPESRTADLTPPGAILYATVFVEPSVDQRRNLSALGDHSNLRGLLPEDDVIARAMNHYLGAAGLEYARDVEPWLGREAGLTMMRRRRNALHVIALFEAEDADRAEMHLAATPVRTEERSYRDVRYRLTRRAAEGFPGRSAFGIVDDFLVMANPRTAFEAVVDAARGASLADDPAFASTMTSLPEDRLGAAYVSDPALATRLALPPLVQGLAAKLGASGGPVTLSLHAEPDALVLGSSAGDPVRLEPDLLASLIQVFRIGR